MGPSGSGKTTFLNCISTIDEPTNGTVLINGMNPYELNDDQLAKFRRNELGFVFQDFNLVNTLTVEENIILPLTLDGVSERKMMKRLDEMLFFLGIEEIRNKRTYEISGGQKQRVAIARAVVHNPKLILADEPTGNLDSKSVEGVLKLFHTIHETFKNTILMVTHDPYVASFAERVIFIKDGSIYYELHRGKHRKEFYQLDHMNFLGGDGYEL